MLVVLLLYYFIFKYKKTNEIEKYLNIGYLSISKYYNELYNIKKYYRTSIIIPTGDTNTHNKMA